MYRLTLSAGSSKAVVEGSAKANVGDGGDIDRVKALRIIELIEQAEEVGGGFLQVA